MIVTSLRVYRQGAARILWTLAIAGYFMYTCHGFPVALPSESTGSGVVELAKRQFATISPSPTGFFKALSTETLQPSSIASTRLFSIGTLTSPSQSAGSNQMDLSTAKDLGLDPSGKYLSQDGPWSLFITRDIWGSIALVLGLFLLLKGHKVGGITILLSGFIVLALITYIALANSEPPEGFTIVSDQVLYLFTPFCVGLCAFLLFWAWFTLGKVVVGGLGFFFFIIWLCSWTPNHLFKPKEIYALLVIVPIMASMLTASLQFVMIIFSTAFTGSYLVVFGCSLLANSQFQYALISILNHNSARSWQVGVNVYVSQAMVLLGFLMSVAWQQKHNKGDIFALTFKLVAPPDSV